MKDTRGVNGMVKYAAKRSGSRDWKSLVVNKLMHGVALEKEKLRLKLIGL